MASAKSRQIFIVISKMNIGILTHCIANNFGANLQALSTAMYLRKHGHNAIFFFWDDYLKKRSTRMNQLQLEQHRNFLSSFGFELSQPCSTDDEFIKEIKKYNIHNIIIGSDAVFTYATKLDRYSFRKFKLTDVSEDRKFPNPFWVPFVSKIDQCRYFYLSPSCQSTNYRFIEKNVKNKMRNIMSESSFLCARDTCTKDMMKYILGGNVDIPITPDPVWGFTSNVDKIPSKEEILLKYNLKQDYMLISFYDCPLSVEWLSTFQQLCKQDGIELYSLPMPQGNFDSKLPQIKLPVNPLDWFSIIKYSKGYVGNNMHPVIVSMHNRVPFFSIDQHGKRVWRFFFDKTSKVYDLLKRFGFQNQRVSVKNISKCTPEMVYNNLIHFNVEKCDAVAVQMEMEYQQLMSKICKNFLVD